MLLHPYQRFKGCLGYIWKQQDANIVSCWWHSELHLFLGVTSSYVQCSCSGWFMGHICIVWGKANRKSEHTDWTVYFCTCTFNLETKNTLMRQMLYRRDKSLLIDVKMFCDLISVGNESCCCKCSHKNFLSNVTDKMYYGNNHFIGYDCIIWALELTVAFIWSRWNFIKMAHVSIT